MNDNPDFPTPNPQPEYSPYNNARRAGFEECREMVIEVLNKEVALLYKSNHLERLDAINIMFSKIQSLEFKK